MSAGQGLGHPSSILSFSSCLLKNLATLKMLEKDLLNFPAREDVRDYQMSFLSFYGNESPER